MIDLRSTRRRFIAGTAAALGSSASLFSNTVHTKAEAAVNEGAPIDMKPLDYGLSFLCGTADFNRVRFWVESRTRVIDEQSGRFTDYYQCASCKSENTFAERDLFHVDNYDFLPIFGGGDLLVFRRPANISPNYRTVSTAAEVWGDPDLKMRHAGKTTLLDNWDRIRQATADGTPIVTQTELANADSGLRAIIECPVKTMNISIDLEKYQVDTGPIALPDLTKRYEREIDCLRLAFIAFNAPDFADFVVEQPTPVIEEGEERCKIYHYSTPSSLPAKNTVFAVEAAK